MGTENVIFQGSFLYHPQRNTYHKVNVVLNKVVTPGDEQERYCLSIHGRDFGRQNVVFSAKELCYVEKDETEIRKRQSWPNCLGDRRSKSLTCSIIWIVIKQHDQETSRTLRLLQKEELTRQSDNGLHRLHGIMMDIIESVPSWFGHYVDSMNNVQEINKNERLVATPRNVCVLNSDMETLSFHLTENKSVSVNFDSDINVLTIKIKEDCGHSSGIENFVRVQSLRFCSNRGREIQRKLEKLWKNCIKSCAGSGVPSLSGPVDIQTEIIQSRDETLRTRGTEVWFNRATGERNVISDNICAPQELFLPLPVNDTNSATFLKQIDDSYLPPPSPCTPPGGIFADTPHDLWRQKPVDNPESAPGHICPVPHVSESSVTIPKGVLRTQSDLNLRDQCFQDLLIERPTENYSDDYQFDDIYYKNTGWIKCHKSSMRTRIKRRSRLSIEIKDVDFSTVDKHEVWFEQSFRVREADVHYRRVNKVYESVPPQTPQNLPPNIPADDDDPYWNSDLCLTVQYVLEDKIPKLHEIFDLSFTQMVGICVHLSVEKLGHAPDWRDLAEKLELNGQDIEIVQHFCYKYRKWTAEVVLIHWVFQMRRQRSVPECCYDTLKIYLQQLDRDDLIAIMESEHRNDDNENFWEENTRM